MNNLPRIIEHDDKTYELRIYHKESGLPYYPKFHLSASNILAKRMTIPDDYEITYKTVLRLKQKGKYYDIIVAYRHIIGPELLQIQPEMQVHIVEQIINRFTSEVYKAQLLYKCDNNEPSEYQLDERIRVILTLDPNSYSMIKNLPEDE